MANTADLTSLHVKSRRLLGALTLGDALPVPCLPDRDLETLHGASEFDAIRQEVSRLSNKDNLQSHVLLIWIEACLRNPNGVETSTHSYEQALSVRKWVIKSIVPHGDWISTSPDSDDNDASKLKRLKLKCKALAAFRLIKSLYRLFPELQGDSDPMVITCYASFTEQDDPWSSPESSKLAVDLIALHSETKTLITLSLAFRILDNSVRPAFLDSRNDAITEGGRKSAYSSPTVPMLVSTSTTKLWKAESPYVATLLSWLLRQLNQSDIEPLWAKLIPPILTLLDDETTIVKVKGCKLLAMLLKRVPPGLLQRTGLGDVFEDTLLPFLSYLPPMTPEDQSLMLLGIAYSTILSLIEARSPNGPTEPKVRAYDKIMRAGIFNGLAHSGEYVKVAELLTNQLNTMISFMGIHSVKHLKDIMPLLVSNISDPFAFSYVPLLMASVQTLQTVILNDWPRMEFYKGTILEALSACWCRVNTDDIMTENNSIRTKEQLRVTARLLTTSLVNEHGAADEIEHVLRNESRLRGLLST